MSRKLLLFILMLLPAYALSQTPQIRVDRLIVKESPWTDVMAFNTNAHPIDKTGVSDSTAGIKAAIDSLTDGGTLMFPPGTYRVVYPHTYPADSADYPRAVFVIPSNVHIVGSDTTIYHDRLADDGNIDLPYTFAIWGAVENISIEGIKFLGRSDHTHDGATSGTFIGIRSLAFDGTSWDANPDSIDDVPRNITIKDCTFSHGREAIHIGGEMSLDSVATVYSPYNVKIENVQIEEFEHGIGLMYSVQPVLIKNVVLKNASFMQRGIAMWGSSNVLIDNVYASRTSATAYSAVIYLSGELDTAAYHNCSDITISNITIDTPSTYEALISMAIMPVPENGYIHDITIENVNVVNGGGFTIYGRDATNGDIYNIALNNVKSNLVWFTGVDNVRITNSHFRELHLTNVRGMTVSNSTFIQTNAQAPDYDSLIYLIDGNSNILVDNSHFTVPDYGARAAMRFGATGTNTNITLSNSYITEQSGGANPKAVITHSPGVGPVTNLTLENNIFAVTEIIYIGGGVFTGVSLRGNRKSGAFTNNLTIAGGSIDAKLLFNEGLGTFSPAITDAAWGNTYAQSMFTQTGFTGVNKMLFYSSALSGSTTLQATAGTIGLSVRKSDDSADYPLTASRLYTSVYGVTIPTQQAYAWAAGTKLYSWENGKVLFQNAAETGFSTINLGTDTAATAAIRLDVTGDYQPNISIIKGDGSDYAPIRALKFVLQSNAVLTATSNGKIEVRNATDAADAILQASKVIFSATSSPAATDACTAGTITWSATHIYVCTASGAWKRAELTGGY